MFNLNWSGDSIWCLLAALSCLFFVYISLADSNQVQIHSTHLLRDLLACDGKLIIESSNIITDEQKVLKWFLVNAKQLNITLFRFARHFHQYLLRFCLIGTWINTNHLANRPNGLNTSQRIHSDKRNKLTAETCL